MAGARVAIIGFGEVGSTFARGLAAGGAEVEVYSRPREGLSERVRAVGARPAASAAAAAGGADLVLLALPARCEPPFAELAPALGPDAITVDFCSAAPELKAGRAGQIRGYVDAAILGTVTVAGLSVPIAASGERAPRFARFGSEHGMRVDVIEGPAGQAARLKLLRSVYMKGRDALVVEMLLTARRLGLDQAVLASIGGPAEQVPFPDLAERLITGVAVHAERRADELTAAAELLERSGVEPLMTRAGARLLSEIADTGLREAFGGHRPGDAGEVLAELERLFGRRL